MKCRLALWAVVILTVLGAAVIADAQWREGQLPVLTPPALVKPAEKPDYAAKFLGAYTAARKPKVILFWNRKFDDRFSAPTQDVDITRKDKRRNYRYFEQATKKPAGTATMFDGDEFSSETKVHTKRTEVMEAPERQTDLSERNSIELETAFREQMRRGGVSFVDRDTVVRTTHAKGATKSNDPKEVETTAVLESADLLLEILFVPDSDGPIGYGFRVSVRNIESGVESVAFYTLGRPWVPALPGRYVATTKGYEWSQSKAQAGIQDVGAALADELMDRLAPRL